MHLRILDLDGSIPLQKALLTRYRPTLVSTRDWGPHIRMACSFRRFRRFERTLAAVLESDTDAPPAITLCGSGDFHHVSLALLRRLTTPINLLVLDNHPDWMRGVPFLHCGTWLYHAARLPAVARIYHVGGDVDFDNYYRWLAPWRLLHSRKITVFPAIRRFQRGAWSALGNEPLRPQRAMPVSRNRIEELLDRFRTELADRPLYISLDKDVLWEKEAVVNWDSGHLTLAEISDLLHVFVGAAKGNLAGMDIVGDWSALRLRGSLRYLMHFTEHPALVVNADDATRRNEQTNLVILDSIAAAIRAAASPSLCHSSTP